MPIRHERFITRDMLRAEPDTLFVFGDNLQRRGLGGQAKEMRGEPNAVGIPTKRAPGMHPVDFFSDGDLADYDRESAEAWRRLEDHARAQGVIVLPSDGLGTERANLERCAPRIFAGLQIDLSKLQRVAVFAAESRLPVTLKLNPTRA